MEYSDKNPLGSESYDRELTDIFAIQDEISVAVTTALSITLQAGEFNQPGMTSNIEAYDELMLGRKKHQEATSGQGYILDATVHFERAVQIDPLFAEGWLQMARVYITAFSILPLSETEGFESRITRALSEVRSLVPDYPGLFIIEANILAIADHQFVEAERILLELLGSSGGINGGAAASYAQLLFVTGQVEEALKFNLQARRLEPLQAQTAFLLSANLLSLNRTEEAMLEIERGLTLEGSAQNMSGNRFVAALQSNDKVAALEALESFRRPTTRP